MEASKHVIVVLSRNYLDNPLNLFELDIATEIMYEAIITNIILIDIGNGLPRRKIPKHLTNTMKRNKILECSDCEESKELMRTKVKDTLRRAHEPAADKDAE